MNAMDQSAMTIVGTVTTMNILGNNVYINGSGKIETLKIRGAGLTNYCKTDNTVSNPYKTVKDIKAARKDSGKATESSPTVTMRLALSNMPEGWSEVDLVWFVDSKEYSRSKRNLLKEGSIISQSYNFSKYLDGFHSSVLFTVYATIDGKQSLIYSGYVNVEESIRTVAQSIRTQNIQGRLRQNSRLCTSRSLETTIKEIPANTQVTVLQSRQSTATRVRLPDGTTGWVRYYDVEILPGTYYITKDYSTAVKEYYVNNTRKWGSSTGYMIWVSLYTQRINIFKGSKGKWKLVRSGPIASGRNDCPTPVEDKTILYKTPQWNYPEYYCHHVSVFDEARGFHSRPTAYNGSVYYAAIGYPASNGCVRLMDEDCIFIYNNCAVGTAVHIY